MSFAPPPGPPAPPVVPEGWKTQFDDRYKQWFFVNLRTGKSQWEPPEGSAKAEEALPDQPSTPPPAYEHSGPAHPDALANTSETKPLGSNNPYNPNRAGDGSSIEDDARLAARLQAEEDARAGPVRGTPTKGSATDYYNEPARPQTGSPRISQGATAAPQTLTPPPGSRQRSRSRGLMDRLMGKTSGSSSGLGHMRPPPPPPRQYAYHPGGYYGGYPPQPPMGYGYGYPGYPPQGAYYPAPQRRHGGGMGTAGAAALGVGGGLLGGALLADAVDDWGDHGGYDGGYGGDDMGDMGGDDFGGDF